MKVLFVCAQSPWPARSGTPIRSQGWIKTAAQFLEVGLVALTRSRAEAALASEAERHCAYVRIVMEPLAKRQQVHARLLALTRLMPFYYQEYWSRPLQRAVSAAISEWHPDAVQAEWIGSAHYLDAPLADSIPCIYSSHNLEHLVVAGPNAGLRRLLAWPFARQMGRVERTWAERAALVACVTKAEADWFKLVNPCSHFVPNALMVRDYHFKSPLERQGGPVAFIGHLGYPPNQAAAVALGRQVYPHLRRSRPDLQCVIAGLKPNREVLSLVGDGVAVYDNVENMAAIWSRISLLICPLTWGAGSRIKLLEAAAYGVPIVATPVSVEGLNFRPDLDYMAANSPIEMAEKALELILDCHKAKALAHRARETVLLEHDWAALIPRLQKLYAAVGGSGVRIRDESQ